MITPEKWLHRPFDADIISAVFEDSANGKCWWLLDKRGMVHSSIGSFQVFSLENNTWKELVCPNNA